MDARAVSALYGRQAARTPSAGDTRANNFTIDLGGTSLSGVYKASTGSKTHLIVDVFGYYK